MFDWIYVGEFSCLSWEFKPDLRLELQTKWLLRCPLTHLRRKPIRRPLRTTMANADLAEMLDCRTETCAIFSVPVKDVTSVMNTGRWASFFPFLTYHFFIFYFLCKLTFSFQGASGSRRDRSPARSPHQRRDSRERHRDQWVREQRRRDSTHPHYSREHSQSQEDRYQPRRYSSDRHTDERYQGQHNVEQHTRRRFGVCFKFRDTGRCAYGAHCKYTHW